MKTNRNQFVFVDDEQQAKQKCAEFDAQKSYYNKKHHPAHYTAWSSSDKAEYKFVVWF
jgi:hypothetical protein